MPTLRLLGLRKDPFQVPKSVQEVGGGVGCQIMGLSVTSSIWVGKPLPLRCKSFNHADSVLTKSCEPMGARNSQHDVIMRFTAWTSDLQDPGKGMEKAGIPILLKFLHNKDRPSLSNSLQMRNPKGQLPLLHPTPHTFSFLFAISGQEVNENALQNYKDDEARNEYLISTQVGIFHLDIKTPVASKSYTALSTFAWIGWDA